MVKVAFTVNKGKISCSNGCCRQQPKAALHSYSNKVLLFVTHSKEIKIFIHQKFKKIPGFSGFPV